MSKDVEFTYNATVSNSGTINVNVSAHMIALLLSEKLGLPMPMRNRSCQIAASPRPGDEEDTPDNECFLTYIYEAVPTEGPVTLKLPGKPDEAQA